MVTKLAASIQGCVARVYVCVCVCVCAYMFISENIFFLERWALCVGIPGSKVGGGRLCCIHYKYGMHTIYLTRFRVTCLLF